ncbi:MAG: hypothetical protein V3U32_01540 [Anaerolineales bacterium]
MIHLEASKKNWALLFDGAYLGLGDARGPLDADLDEVWAEISVQTNSSMRRICTRRLRTSPGEATGRSNPGQYRYGCTQPANQAPQRTTRSTAAELER